jgi:DNA-binding MarR family transcriptional regulator
MSPRPRHQTDAGQTAEALGRVALLTARWIERLLSAHDPPLTVAQYLVLQAVAEGNAVGADLARQAAVSPPAVSQLLTALEAGRLVERLRTGDDRRRQALTLTKNGQQALQSSQALLRKELATLVSALPPHESDALGQILPTLAAALSGQTPPRRPPPKHHPPPRHHPPH